MSHRATETKTKGKFEGYPNLEFTDEELANEYKVLANGKLIKKENSQAFQTFLKTTGLGDCCYCY